jgi:hypothetical protein
MLTAGTQTGSLINHLYSRGGDLTPKIGMGVTMLGWTDRHAATIVEVKMKGLKVGIVQDIAIRTDNNGMSETQQYSYAPGNGGVMYYTLRQNGKWVAEGQGFKNGSRIVIGFRDEYYDFSF